MGKSLSVATYLPLSTLTIGDTIIGLGGAVFHHRPSPRLQRATSMSFSKNRDQTTDRRDPIQENADVDGRSSWLHAESPILISNDFGLENVHRPVRNRNLWRGLQPLKPLVIDRDKALVNTVSMKAVAAEQKG